MNMEDFSPDETFDIVYSVSVIEHMTADIRRTVIGQLARLTRPGGALLLSLDLFPGTCDLWNYNEGRVVDEGGHGTLEDIEGEIEAAGFAVTSRSFVRAMPLSRTDVAYLVCARH
jgi:SAM-dependent methyltransferase